MYESPVNDVGHGDYGVAECEGYLIVIGPRCCFGHVRIPPTRRCRILAAQLLTAVKLCQFV